MLTNKIKEYMEKSVLCWLATSSPENSPNDSPKEIFTYHGNDTILIANIASPHSVKNIEKNENVCISFIDIFIQKGYKIKGVAKILNESHDDFNLYKSKLEILTEGKFPFNSIIYITIKQISEILAPRYIIFPETTEEEQILSAEITYGVV